MRKQGIPDQLQMTFETDSRLAAALRQGRFQIIVELNAPAAVQPFDSAMAVPAAMAARLAGDDDVAAVAVTDRLRTEDSHDPVQAAQALMQASGKPILLHLSGKGTTDERARATLAAARSAGIQNVLALTGDRSDKHPMQGGNRPGRHPVGYLDSVETIRLARRADARLCIGAAVNPFKYNPADQYLQYYKMMRKLASGAAFVVAQAGWDMKKLQELQWYLAMRQNSSPVLARLQLLSYDDVRGLTDTVSPGVQVAREFIAVLQRESDISATQCLAAQLPRIGLQAAGCRVLGYSGIQLAGIRDQGTLDMVLNRVREALRTHTTYDAWLEAWLEYHGNLSFAPVSDAYYGFDGLLQPGCAAYDPATSVLTERDFPRVSLLDRLRGLVLPYLLSEPCPPSVSDAYRAICRGGDDAPAEHLREVFYLDRRRCPKQLVHGACGGSTPDGGCEFGHGRCFFHRVLSLAASQRDLERLEEPVPHD